MRMRSSFAAAVVAAMSAVVFSAAFQPAEASFIFYAEQVGANVVITGTGSINTSTFLTFGIPSFNYQGEVQTQRITSGIGTGTSNTFLAGNSGDSTVSLSSFVANVSSGPGIDFQAASGIYTVPASIGSGVPFGNSATYNNRTLADFGWTAGTYANPTVNKTFTLTNAETIQIVSVPEPTQMVSVAVVGAAYGAWRLRKLRRSREAAGDAIAS
jgi:hypothetical protein